MSIYFDNGSTSFPKAPGVGESICQLLTTGAYNVGRGSYESAYALSAVVYDTRQAIADLVGFSGECNKVVFGQNVTQALNPLLFGFL